MSNTQTPTSTLATAPAPSGSSRMHHEDRQREAQVDDARAASSPCASVMSSRRGRIRPATATRPSAERRGRAGCRARGRPSPRRARSGSSAPEVARPAQRPRGRGEAVELVQPQHGDQRPAATAKSGAAERHHRDGERRCPGPRRASRLRQGADPASSPPAEPAVAAARTRRARARRSSGPKSGHSAVREVQLGVGALPEQEVRQALLAAGADDQLGVAHVGRVEVLGELVLARLGPALGREAPRRVDDLAAGRRSSWRRTGAGRSLPAVSASAAAILRAQLVVELVEPPDEAHAARRSSLQLGRPRGRSARRTGPSGRRPRRPAASSSRWRTRRP